MIARKALLILLGNGMGAVTGLGILYIIGRFMGPEPYGALAFAISIAGIAAVAVHGLHAAHVRQLNSDADAGDAFTTFAGLKVGGTLILASVGIMAAIAWDRFSGFTDATTLAAIVVAMGLMVADEMRNVFVVHFEGLRRIASAQAIYLIENITRLPLVLVAAWFFGFGSGLEVPFKQFFAQAFNMVSGTRSYDAGDGAVLLGLAFAGAAILSGAAGASLAWRQQIRPGRFQKFLASSYLHYAAPMAVSSAVAVFATKMDSIMVGYFWGAADVGHYYAAQRITGLLAIVPLAFGTIFFPIITELVAVGDARGIKALAETTQRTIALLMVLASTLVLVYAEEGIALIMGPAFLPAAPIARALSLFLLMQAIVTPHIHVILAKGETRLLMWISMVTVAAVFSLNLVFVPTSIGGVPLAGLAGLGAAIGTLIGQVGFVVALVVVVRRLTGVWVWSPAIVRMLLAGVATAAALINLRNFTPWETLGYAVGLLLQAMVGTGLYLAILILMKEVGRKDLLAFRDLMNPRNMVEDIGQDLGLRRD